MSKSIATVKHPCAGMTRRQREAFERIAIGDDTCLHPATAEALIKRGLIERHEQRGSFGGLPLTIYHYDVPWPIHIQWCEWCAAQGGDE